MASVGVWFALAGFVFLLILSRPPVYRWVGRELERVGDWHAAVSARRDLARQDPEEAELWRWNRRMRLCGTLRRVERLIETDDWMSATRQIGNRMARDQILRELSRDGDLTVAWFATGDEWFEPASSTSTSWLADRGPGSRSTVEVVDFQGTRAIHSRQAA